MTDDDRTCLWDAVLAHRERLLRIARARTPTEQDAEDVVQEAMLRCVEFHGLDEERLGQFLTTVTVRLCADRYREHWNNARLLRRLSGRDTTAPGPEDDVCERVEAERLARVVDDLPEKQREVVRARQAGLSHAEVAARLRISYTAVESSMARARLRFRDALERGASLLWPVAWRWSPAVEAALVTAVVVGGISAGGAPQPAAPVPVHAPRVAVATSTVRPTVTRPVRPRPVTRNATPSRKKAAPTLSRRPDVRPPDVHSRERSRRAGLPTKVLPPTPTKCPTVALGPLRHRCISVGTIGSVVPLGP